MAFRFQIFSDGSFVMVCASTSGTGVAGLGFLRRWLRQVNHTEICQAECQSSASGTGACSSAWKVVPHCCDLIFSRGAVQDAKKAQSPQISKEQQ